MRYWLLSNAIYLLAIIILFFSPFVHKLQAANLFIGIAILILLSKVFWNFIVLLNVKFIISSEQIILKKGVINKSVDFVEMYRIYDYQKKQNILEVVSGLMKIYLSSRDMSHPFLKLYGIPNNNDLIDEIRKRVERQKEVKHIYEFNNSGFTI